MFLCSIRRIPRLTLRPLSTLTTCGIGTPKPSLPSMLIPTGRLEPIQPKPMQLKPQFEPLHDPSTIGNVSMELDSVMRKRRKKMKKHKLRKRRKREKADRRRLSQGR